MEEEPFLKQELQHTSIPCSINLSTYPVHYTKHEVSAQNPLHTGLIDQQYYQEQTSYPFEHNNNYEQIYGFTNGNIDEQSKQKQSDKETYMFNQQADVFSTHPSTTNGQAFDSNGIDYYRKMQMMEQECQKKQLQNNFNNYQKSWEEEYRRPSSSNLQNLQMQQEHINYAFQPPKQLQSPSMKDSENDEQQQQQQQNLDEGGTNDIKEEKQPCLNHQQPVTNQLSELAFEEFAFTEQLFTGSEKNSKNNGQLIEKYILHPSIKPVEAFLINGEIILSFEVFDTRPDKEHNKVSLWNMFRPISQITVMKKLIEVSMHKSQGALNDFQPLIQRLLSMPDQQAFKSGQMLQQHYLSLQDEQLIKQQVFEVYKSRISHLQWQLEENFHRSKEMAYNLMDQLPEDAFFLYSIRRTDPITLDSIFCALGYSKALIRLIAGNESNYQQFCFRSGLAEIFNGSSRLQILLMNLLFSNKVEITITTLDDYTIPIEMRVHYQKLVSTEVLPGIFKEDYMKIYQILIDTKYIEELKRIRGSESSLMSGKIGAFDGQIVQPDPQYQESATKFIEKFYSDQLKDKSQKNGKKNAADPKDPNNFSAVFQRIFGNQNEGQNYLTSVFNTKVTSSGIQNLSRSQQLNESGRRNSQSGEELSASSHSSRSQQSSVTFSNSFQPDSKLQPSAQQKFEQASLKSTSGII